jgi:hypothetical protein
LTSVLNALDASLHNLALQYVLSHTHVSPASVVLAAKHITEVKYPLHDYFAMHPLPVVVQLSWSAAHASWVVIVYDASVQAQFEHVPTPKLSNRQAHFLVDVNTGVVTHTLSLLKIVQSFYTSLQFLANTQFGFALHTV